jgi:thioredoxin-like negative regulator of GroEL
MPCPVCVWAANLLVPGAGEVLLGRLWMGPIRAVVWGALVAQAMFRAIFRADSGSLTWAAVLGGLAAAVYLGGQVSLWLRMRAARRWLGNELRNSRFKAALAAYLQGRLDDCESACRELLREDPDDVEATLQLASVARRRGDPASARRRLLRARYLDDDGRWDGQIGRELAALGPPAARHGG